MCPDITTCIGVGETSIDMDVSFVPTEIYLAVLWLLFQLLSVLVLALAQQERSQVLRIDISGVITDYIGTYHALLVGFERQEE